MNWNVEKKGYVTISYRRHKDGPKTWHAKVGGLDEDNRFELPEEFPTPGKAIDAAVRWARQRKMILSFKDVKISVLG